MHIRISKRKRKRKRKCIRIHVHVNAHIHARAPAQKRGVRDALCYDIEPLKHPQQSRQKNAHIATVNHSLLIHLHIR